MDVLMGSKLCRGEELSPACVLVPCLAPWGPSSGSALQLQSRHSNLHLKYFISDLWAGLTHVSNQKWRPKKLDPSFPVIGASGQGGVIPKQITRAKAKIFTEEGEVGRRGKRWASHSTAMPQESATFNVIKLYIAAIWKQFQSINNSCKKTAEEQKNQIPI